NKVGLKPGNTRLTEIAAGVHALKDISGRVTNDINLFEVRVGVTGFAVAMGNDRWLVRVPALRLSPGRISTAVRGDHEIRNVVRDTHTGINVAAKHCAGYPKANAAYTPLHAIFTGHGRLRDIRTRDLFGTNGRSHYRNEHDGEWDFH